MIRRSFRFGMWVGVLSGIAFAIVKIMQRGRPGREPAAWTPVPPRAAVEPDPAPVVPRPEPIVPQPEPEPILPRPEPEPPAPEPIVPSPTPEPLVPDPKPEPPAPAPQAAKKAAKKAASASKKKAAPGKRTLATWIDPVGGICPDSHPVKAKLASKIFHVPGGINYTRTTPDRCYQTPAAAEADGHRPAKR